MLLIKKENSMRLSSPRPLSRAIFSAVLLMQGTIVVQAATAAPTANFTFRGSNAIIGVFAFTDTSAGSPTSWLWNFGDPASGTANTSTSQGPVHVFLSAGTFTVSLTATNATGSNTTTKSVIVAAGAPVDCNTADSLILCLNSNRFAVSVDWEGLPAPGRIYPPYGNGIGTKLTDDSGYFTFFDAANVEVVVKVLNACGQPTPAYWVFAAGLTNVQVTLTVLDTHLGIAVMSVNPQGTAFVPIQNTNAFLSSCP